MIGLIIPDLHAYIARNMVLKDYLNYKASCIAIYRALAYATIPKVHIYDASYDVMLYKFTHLVLEYTKILTQGDINMIASSPNKNNVWLIMKTMDDQFFSLDFSKLHIMYLITRVKHVSTETEYSLPIHKIIDHVKSDCYMFNNCRYEKGFYCVCTSNYGEQPYMCVHEWKLDIYRQVLSYKT